MLCNSKEYTKYDGEMWQYKEPTILRLG